MDANTLALAKEVASTLESSPSNTSLSPITLYRTGRILYACILNGSTDAPILTSFDRLLSSLGHDYVQSMLRKLHVGCANLIVSFASTSSAIDASLLSSLIAQTPNFATKTAVCTYQDVIEATESLCGIYLASKSACQFCGSIESSSELDIVFSSFTWVYEHISSDSFAQIKEMILQTVSAILIHGIVQPIADDSEDEQLSGIMNIIQRIQSSGGEHNCAMGDLLQMEQNKDHSFVKALTTRFADGPQLQYTLAMLKGFPSSDSKPSDTAKLASSKPQTLHEATKPKQSQRTMIDIQIDHVKSVLPDLGEGYVQEALNIYNNNVERTIDALLQLSENPSSIHPKLLTLPKNLPRKLKDLPEQYTANVDMHRGSTAKHDGMEHVMRQKQYIKEVERQAEEEAYLVENVSRALGGLRVQQKNQEEVQTDDFGITGNEYDDDYDDQYDGVGDDGGMAGGIGGMDEGLYDVDVHNVHQKYDRGGAKNEQEMWRQYNKLIRGVDAESQFWEDSRNLNRQNNKLHKGNKENEEEDLYDDDDGEKKYRGPDKGRGGRLIGPDGKYLPIQRGGKKGRGNGAVTDGGNQNAGRGGRGGRSGGRGTAGKAKPTNNNAQKVSQQKDGDDMSKIQKRRKNDNKAKIGNHHRKDRATKKASSGMMH